MAVPTHSLLASRASARVGSTRSQPLLSKTTGSVLSTIAAAMRPGDALFAVPPLCSTVRAQGFGGSRCSGS